MPFFSGLPIYPISVPNGGATGLVFNTAVATSLLAVGAGLLGQNILPLATVSVAPVRTFAAGSVLKADVSGGTLPTGGAVIVEILGALE